MVKTCYYKIQFHIFASGLLFNKLAGLKNKKKMPVTICYLRYIL